MYDAYLFVALVLQHAGAGGALSLVDFEVEAAAGREQGETVAGYLVVEEQRGLVGDEEGFVRFVAQHVSLMARLSLRQM